jgi:hypothetical protein
MNFARPTLDVNKSARVHALSRPLTKLIVIFTFEIYTVTVINVNGYLGFVIMFRLQG